MISKEANDMSDQLGFPSHHVDIDLPIGVTLPYKGG